MGGLPVVWGGAGEEELNWQRTDAAHLKYVPYTIPEK
jgi:hypothetical protein